MIPRSLTFIRDVCALMSETIEIHGTLERWAEDKKYNVIWGFIYGDTKGRFRDGTWIHTSNIVERKGKIIKTLNSTYKLGKKFKPRANG